MPSPYPFLNLGKSIANRVILGSRDSPVSPAELERLGGGLASRSLKEDLSMITPPSFGESRQEFGRNFINEQIRPLFMEKYGDAPEMALLHAGISGRAPLAVLGVLGPRPEWSGPMTRMGFSFLARTKYRDSFVDLYMIPEDFLTGERGFLHE